MANVVVALNCDFATWVWFVAFGAFGAKLAALLVQYVVFRTIVVRALRRPLAVPAGS